MQDLASRFSKTFRGDPLPHPTPSRALDRARGATQTLVPLNFSAVVAPLVLYRPTVKRTIQNSTGEHPEAADLRRC